MPHKQRSTKLLSWLTHWICRGNKSEDDRPAEPSCHETPLQPQSSDLPANESIVQPISMPTRQPSTTSTVTGSIESFFSSSIASSVFDDQNSSLSGVAASRPRHDHRFSALASMAKDMAQDDLFSRIDSSLPKQLKRYSLPSPSNVHRPTSLFSLQAPVSNKNASSPAAHIGEPWPRSDRRVMRQELVRLVLDGLFYSPLDMSVPRKVLHIGCGDGAWCVDMANQYPSCSVVGMDSHEISGMATPRNLSFVRCHPMFLRDLKAIPDDQYDLIYGRFLIFSFPSDIYREIIQECWRICRPGGYVEIMEFDMRIYGNPRVGPLTHALNAQVIRVMESRSLEPRFAHHLQDLFFFHQLVEQQHQKPGDAYVAKYVSLPIGVWGGRLGVMFRDDIHDLIEEIRQSQHASETQDIDGYDDDDVFYADSPWSERQLDATLRLVDDELESSQAFLNLHCVYAHKI